MQMDLFGKPTTAKRVLVQRDRKSGELLEVLVDTDGGRCGCGEQGCRHMRYAHDALMMKGETAQYVIKSALHKELRRQNYAMAMHWATWLFRFTNRSTVIDYLRKICTEETGNLHMYVWMHQPDLKIEDVVMMFCRSAKRWESMDWWTCQEAFYEPLAEKHHKIASWYQEDTIREFASAQDISMFGRAFAGAEPDGKLTFQYRRLLVQVAEQVGVITPEQAVVFRKRYASGRFENEDVTLCMALCGLIPGGFDEYHDIDLTVDQSLVDGSVLMLPPRIAYDMHVRDGKKIIADWKARHPGQKILMGVDTDPIDLRWSGGMLPFYWRFEAFEQVRGTSEMDQIRWHELVPDPKRYQRFLSWCRWLP